MRTLRWLIAGLLLVLASAPAGALEPRHVFILVNKNVPDSQAVADHYCAKRGVPRANIIPLDLPAGEDISRADYQAKLIAPLRAALKDRRDEAKVLLSVYGVPLRVGRSTPSAAEKEELARLLPELAKAREALTALDEQLQKAEAAAKADPSFDAGRALKELRATRQAQQAKVDRLEQRRRWLTHAESEACVDSELTLLWWDDYETRRWQVNLLYFQVPEALRKDRPPVVMVARLDGPSADLAKRLVDDALAAEAKGLEGKVYVDARGIRYDPKADAGFGYGGYDESLREMARLLEREAKLPVTLDDAGPLFKPGSCPECMLYCGWYSLANYVDCCRFVPGAVAYHIASSEAVSLRNPNSKFWCPNLLTAGAAVTIGPVAEPYTLGFPKPAEFFGFLVTGRYTLVECYSRTLLLNSWMTVLVGDPLYNPFAKTPRLTVEQVKPSPAGGRFFLQRAPEGRTSR